MERDVEPSFLYLAHESVAEHTMGAFPVGEPHIRMEECGYDDGTVEVSYQQGAPWLENPPDLRDGGDSTFRGQLV